MGMTIKEAQGIISEPLYMENVPQKIIDAHRVAIECMRKYHKIEKIIHDIPYGGQTVVRRIQEVVEDGNDD